MKQENKRREASRQNRRHEKQGRSQARHLIDIGDFRLEERQKLEIKLLTLTPSAMRAEIRRLEDRHWLRREELYKVEGGSPYPPVGDQTNHKKPGRYDVLIMRQQDLIIIAP